MASTDSANVLPEPVESNKSPNTDLKDDATNPKPAGEVVTIPNPAPAIDEDLTESETMRGRSSVTDSGWAIRKKWGSDCVEDTYEGFPELDGEEVTSKPPWSPDPLDHMFGHDRRRPWMPFSGGSL
ncbi:unnamed protein product [Cuscuta epithymum]|uniref:Uncharacterized protein n=1 Tax=Cuscuta epithymum TaxID=186058 RepID=A0AAV0DQ16_9ASTE|nr:unnamed protein product [Cuscuta epithymum]